MVAKQAPVFLPGGKHHDLIEAKVDVYDEIQRRLEKLHGVLHERSGKKTETTKPPVVETKTKIDLSCFDAPAPRRDVEVFLAEDYFADAPVAAAEHGPPVECDSTRKAVLVDNHFPPPSPAVAATVASPAATPPPKRDLMVPLMASPSSTGSLRRLQHERQSPCREGDPRQSTSVLQVQPSLASSRSRSVDDAVPEEIPVVPAQTLYKSAWALLAFLTAVFIRVALV